MAKIVPNQTFLDGTDRFEPDQEYEVEDARAYYFAKNGWLAGSAGISGGDVTLDVDATSHGHEAEEG